MNSRGVFPRIRQNRISQLRLLVVHRVLFHECNENLFFALIYGAEFSEVRSKLAVAIAGTEKFISVGLTDQLTAPPAVIPLELKKSLAMAPTLGAVAVRLPALALNY